MLNSPGWAEVHSDRLSLQDGDHKFHLLIQTDGLVFVAGVLGLRPCRVLLCGCAVRSPPRPLVTASQCQRWSTRGNTCTATARRADACKVQPLVLAVCVRAVMGPHVVVDLREDFLAKFGQQYATAAYGALTVPAASMLKAICKT